LPSPFLPYDESQTGSSEHIVGEIPGRELAHRGIVQRGRTEYLLADDDLPATDDERRILLDLFEAKAEEFMDKRVRVTRTRGCIIRP
jgi:hypothetical protein